MRILFILLLLFLVSPGYVNAQEFFDSHESYEKWMSSYYKTPQPDRIIEGITYYTTSDLYSHRSDIVPSSHFYAALLRQQSTLVSKVYELGATHFSVKLKIFVINTLWLVNNQESRELLVRAKKEWDLPSDVRQGMEKILHRQPTWALDAPVRGPLSLDILWSIYGATGERKVIEKIISVLYLIEEGSGNEMMTGGAARWSLTSQASRDDKILSIVKEKASSSEGTTKKVLKEVLAKIKETKENEDNQ